MTTAHETPQPHEGNARRGTKTSEFDYDLPDELIAQEPLPDRAQSKMMVVRRANGCIEHRRFRELPSMLRDGDLLVLNDTRVIPARVFGVKDRSGGRAEVLFLEEIRTGEWRALYHASGRARAGDRLTLAGGRIRAVIREKAADGSVLLGIDADGPMPELLEKEGVIPLPPYIRRPGGPGPKDRERYQTVYARHPGAVAAPTAGMHFTPELLAGISRLGVRHAAITLHVGMGTFKPVKTDFVEDHRMDEEVYIVTEQAASLINETRRAGGRVIAVGSTAVRTIESVAVSTGCVAARSGRSSLFIRPPFTFRVVDAMLTNFHLPKSTLIMMVSAFAGRELILKAYREAVEQRYRFYSYGDCMLII